MPGFDYDSLGDGEKHQQAIGKPEPATKGRSRMVASLIACTEIEPLDAEHRMYVIFACVNGNIMTVGFEHANNDRPDPQAILQLKQVSHMATNQ